MQVYEFPSNRFVANFFGTINLFDATVVSSTEIETDRITIEAALDKTGTLVEAETTHHHSVGDRIAIGVRPEKLTISQEEPNGDNLTITKGIVEDLAYYGNRSIYRVRSQSGRMIQISAQNYQRSKELVLEWDDQVYMSWDSSCSVVLER